MHLQREPNDHQNKIPDEPYDWFQLPAVNEKLRKMAEAKYNQEGAAKALEKIDEMNVDDVKKYLKTMGNL